MTSAGSTRATSDRVFQQRCHSAADGAEADLGVAKRAHVEVGEQCEAGLDGLDALRARDG